MRENYREYQELTVYVIITSIPEIYTKVAIFLWSVCSGVGGWQGCPCSASQHLMTYEAYVYLSKWTYMSFYNTLH